MSNLTTLNYDGQLIQIVEQSNIEPTKGAQMMELFVPYFKRMDEVERKISILPAENPSKEDCEMAKAIRKALRDNRLEAERIKKQGKEAIIIEGRLFDNLYNIIDNSSKPLEKRCEAIEKWHEIEEAKRVEAVYQERKALCDELEADTVFVNIRQMSDEQFQAYIDQIKAAKAAKAEAERIEAERLAEHERQLDHRMKLRLKTLAALDIDGGLMNIREMPDEQFDTFVKSEQAKIAARAAAVKAAEEARIEAAKVAEEQRIAREAAEKEAAKVRDELAAAKKAAELEAAKVAEEQRIAREAAEKEAAKVRDELAAAKKAAELEAAKVAEAERLKAESDRAALLAPDRDKLAFLITKIAGINIPQLETPEAEKITRNVKLLLGKVRTYIEQEAEKL